MILKIINSLRVIGSEFVHEKIGCFHFLIGDLGNVLLSAGRRVTSEVFRDRRVETFEEALELRVFNALRNPGNLRALRLVLAGDEVLGNFHAVLLLCKGGSLALPDVHLVVKFEDVGVSVV